MTRRWIPWPKRIDICLLSFVAMVIAYCDRVNLSVTAPLIMQEYHWDTAQMGWALSGFFMGYTIFMIPAGRLVDHFGPKRVFAASVAWWSIFTAFDSIIKVDGRVNGHAGHYGSWTERYHPVYQSVLSELVSPPGILARFRILLQWRFCRPDSSLPSGVGACCMPSDGVRYSSSLPFSAGSGFPFGCKESATNPRTSPSIGQSELNLFSPPGHRCRQSRKSPG